VRVLFLNPVGVLGGSERSLLDIFASLRDHAPEVKLGLVCGGEGPLLDEAAALGVEVISAPFPERLAVLGDSGVAGSARRTGRLAYVVRLRGVVRTFAPTLIHSNGVKMHVLSVALGSRQLIVWHVRDFVGERPVMAGVLRVAASRASLALANSNAVAEDVRLHLGALPVRVIYNAIDTDVFAPTGPHAQLDELAGLPPAPPHTTRVGLVATYARWKGHDAFLAAAKKVLEKRARPVRFYVIGGPVYRTAGSQYDACELQGMASSLGIASEVGFVPFQQRPENIYRALDIVVHASTRPEPFGRTIVEAMSCGRAVVVAGTGGALELFADGVDAVGVPPASAERLASAIGGLIGDPVRRARLGEAARKSAVTRFARGRLAAEIVAAYAPLKARP
jgi:glycosyltransferase involved in cell wall biosynthesis